MEDKEIAEFLYQWAEKNHIHPNDFEDMFVKELLDKLEGK